MTQKAKMITITSSFISLLVIVVIIVKSHVQNQVKDLFRMNKTLQEQGYYMGDFEFQMLGFSYYLDKGHYIKALSNLSDFHKKLKNKEGLIKIPEFSNHQEEINFYLNLQNPKTGAFIDESAPFCTYWEVTQNVINHMEALVDSTTLPLKLKYPLKFLDEINTPETLTVFLDDISYVGWIASKFPQTTFHFARNMLSCTKPESTLERNGFYYFSPEWKHAMLKWMYNFQDTTTGMWGPKDRKTKKILKYDLNNTASILKSFRNNAGENLYYQFPLKYQDKLFESAVKELSEEYPDEDNLPEIHEWNLKQSKGIKMLLRYLWNDASDDNKEDVIRILKRYIKIYFEKYYVKADGAFSYYPNAEHASLDGNFDMYHEIGAFSYQKQKRLLGDPKSNTIDLVKINSVENCLLHFLDSIKEINSIRIYNAQPDFLNLTRDVLAVLYPKQTEILDVVELVPNIVAWTDSSTLSMGNWTSMEEVKHRYSSLDIQKPLVFKNEFPFEKMKNILSDSSEKYIVGFDILQIPRFVARLKISE